MTYTEIERILRSAKTAYLAGAKPQADAIGPIAESFEAGFNCAMSLSDEEDEEQSNCPRPGLPPIMAGSPAEEPVYAPVAARLRGEKSIAEQNLESQNGHATTQVAEDQEQEPEPEEPEADAEDAEPSSGREARRQEQLAAIAELTEPFSVRETAEALGMILPSASALVNRWQAKGWLQSAVYGEWRRTAKYPEPD